MADSSLPSKGWGGKVMGTRRMVEPMPWSPRIFQKGRLRWRSSRLGEERGIRKRPRLRMRRGLPTRAEESLGR